MKPDFLRILTRLNKEGVKFVIIGGFASVVQGCTFVTQDIDICCEFKPRNLLLLQKAIADLNPVHRITPEKVKLYLTQENCKHYKNLYLDTDLGQLDCISYVKGIGNFDRVTNSSQTIEVEKQKFHVLTIEALIESKEAMNRPHDQEAILQLKAIKKTGKN
jgi:predicted nucleotidyltransferase